MISTLSRHEASICVIRAPSGVAPVRQATLGISDVAVSLRGPVVTVNLTPVMPALSVLSTGTGK